MERSDSAPRKIDKRLEPIAAWLAKKPRPADSTAGVRPGMWKPLRTQNMAERDFDRAWI